MRERYEELLSQNAERCLTRWEKRELKILARESTSFRRMAARDRIVDRLLRQQYRPPIDVDQVMQALGRDRSTLTERTMTALDSAKSPPPSSVAPRQSLILTLARGFQLSGLNSAPFWALSVLVFALTLWWFSARGTSALQIGSVNTVVGTPTRRASGRIPSALQTATPIRFGDRVETGDADKAELQFADGTTLQLNYSTAVEFPKPTTKTLDYSRPPEVKLLRGQVWTKVHKSTNGTPYAVKTDAATALARGTEFGLQVRRAMSTNSSPNAPVETVLTVKEGIVDFYNAFGKVQATAMRESTARAGFAPTEPKRLQTLQTVQVAPGDRWELVTSPLSLPDSGEKLAGGGGFIGLHLRNLTNQVQVTSVHADSPAQRAGLQPGDIVAALERKGITNTAQLQREILFRPASTVSLTIRRKAEEMSFAIAVSSKTNRLGPDLSSSGRAQLSAFALQAVAAEHVGQSGQGTAIQKALSGFSTNPLRAAACNNLGVLYELQDALGPAVRAYERAAYIEPKVPLYRYNLGQSLRKIGNFDRALEEFETASRLAPESIALKVSLAEIHSLLGDEAEAQRLTKAVISQAPADHRAWELQSQLFDKENRPAEALAAARKAVELDPNCPVSRGYLAGALRRQGDLVGAEETYRKALELAPFEAVLQMNFGLVQKERGELLASEESLRKAIELRPDFALGYASLGDFLAERRRFAEAKVAFEKAAELDPSNTDPALALGRLSVMLARADDAEKSFRRVLEMAPENVEAHMGLAHVMEMKHDLPGAERILRRAQEIDPKSAEVHNDLGEVLRESGRPNEAIQSYRKAMELDPDNIAAMNNIAIIQAMRGEYAEAEKMFRKLMNRAVADRRIYPFNFIVNLATVCGKQGKLDEAEKYYRQALKMQPNDPGLASSFAFFLANHQRNLDEALVLARRAVQAAPNEFNFLDNLGWTLFQRGELDEAEKTLQKAVELAGQDPSAPEIREHLKKVQVKQGKK